MRLSRYPKILLIVLVFTLPFICPWVRADGVGYYAYARSLLVEHHLRFENDWRHANLSFRMDSVAPDGQIDPAVYTRTGYLDNRYAVGASLLWAPFLVPVHGIMRVLQRFGSPVQADMREIATIPRDAAPLIPADTIYRIASGHGRDDGEKGGAEHVRAVYRAVSPGRGAGAGRSQDAEP